MNPASDMQVALCLPNLTLFDGAAISLNTVAQNGGFGMLPNHVDFVTALVPSVLLITLPDETERIFGIDEGLLVKQGQRVQIAVRRGVESDDLNTLRQVVATTFIEIEDEERVARTALSRLEANMVRRFVSLRKPQP